MATFVGLGIALAAYFNGKHIKEGIPKIADLLAEMEKTANQREKAADQRHQEAMEFLKKGFGTR